MEWVSKRILSMNIIYRLGKAQESLHGLQNQVIWDCFLSQRSNVFCSGGVSGVLDGQPWHSKEAGWDVGGGADEAPRVCRRHPAPVRHA